MLEQKLKYADVHVGLPVEGPFTYIIPSDFILVTGCRVVVPFGKRKITGYVVNLHNNKPQNFKLKSILEIIDYDPIFDHKLERLAKYVAANYICSVGEVMSVALPSGISAKNRYKEVYNQDAEYEVDLTDAQSMVSRNIIDDYHNKNYLHLIYGITGSGKTEVYIDIAKEIIKQGKSVIYLVPEISLSSQIYQRLLLAFKDELVIYHSNLTKNQRLHNWKKFKTGEAKIAIGTRSAVFMQADDLGLIIIDEEHDGSYKEHSTPRYNARRVALYRSKTENALLVLGSATPSVETLYSAENNVIKMHRLESRFGKAVLPQIEVVEIQASKPDMMLSSILKIYTKEAVDNNKQAIYLLNRRGFSPIFLCGDCKTKLECPHCNISLNYHNDGLLVCHYCGYKIVTPDTCPECGHDELVKVGAGTQRVEEVVFETFHSYKIFRLDQDTSRKKETIHQLVKKMESGEIDILLGTQMVSKGFDFKNVAIVGVLLADIGMSLPDFRAIERIFSLLMQVAGRCGRGDTPGKVIIQTLNKDLDFFKYLVNHDYCSFYKKEIEVRKMLDYPPFARIVRLLVRGTEEAQVARDIDKVSQIITQKGKPNSSEFVLLGPSPAPLSKIGGNYRYHIILKSRNLDLLREIAKYVYSKINSNKTYLEIDVDPYDML
jgi:primosomal protein N' (replication factor Y)